MGDLHVPDYAPHRCTPTQDAYDAACRALDARRRDLNELEHTLLGALENGSWVLIPDERLRAFVGAYVADALRAVAEDGGLDETAERCRAAVPGRLPMRLEGAA